MSAVSESPSRYQRSFPGMIGALLVTLALIGAFVLFRALNRDNQTVRPEPVDWLGSVRYIQESGASVVYPATQPEGWTATSADYRPGERPLWDIGFLTADDEFVGLHEEDAAVESLIDELVDEDAVEGDPVQIGGALQGDWRTFTDSGGDYAVVTDVAGQAVVVFGSADPAVIRDFASTLTEAHLTR